MAPAIGLREDFGSAGLRTLAKSMKGAAQARRLIDLAIEIVAHPLCSSRNPDDNSCRFAGAREVSLGRRQSARQRRKAGSPRATAIRPPGSVPVRGAIVTPATAATAPASGSDRPVKRSLTLRGHRTSVGLEAAFQTGVQCLAVAEGKPAGRFAAGTGARGAPLAALGSAIRGHVSAAVKAGN